MVWALPIPMTSEGQGFQERFFWAELSDIWALNLDPIFVFGEVDSALLSNLP